MNDGFYGRPKLPVKLDPGARMPTRAFPWDAGLDIHAREDFAVPGRQWRLVPTGVHVAIPRGDCGLLGGRSGLASRGVRPLGFYDPATGEPLGGWIDHGYTGEVGVILMNHSDKLWVPQPGKPIAQLVILPVHFLDPELVESLPEADRGDGGFGHTDGPVPSL